MNDRILDTDEVMKLVLDVLNSSDDTKVARNGIINLMNNPAYNISNNLKSVFLHVASSDKALEEFKNGMTIDEDNNEPVVIPETKENVFFDKLMSRRVQRARLLENRVIVPYNDNNKQFIYALINGSFSNQFDFILTNSKSNANFVLSSSDKDIDNEQFYSKMNVVVDKIDANRNYLDTSNQELVKMVHLFDMAIDNNIDFNIGITPKVDGREIIVSLNDKEYEEKLRNSGVSIVDGKLRITDNFVSVLDRVEGGLGDSEKIAITSVSDYNGDSISYRIYEDKKVDGTDIKTELYQENNGSRVYMSTSVSNLEVGVNARRDYLFTSKDLFYNNLAQFFKEEDLIEKRNGTIVEKNDQSLSYTVVLDDGRVNKFEGNVSVDNYSEVTGLYSQFEKVQSVKEEQDTKNNQANSMGGQVLVKSNPALPPVLPSQEKTSGGINNSGFSNTFLFVTVLALEIMAIAFGIFMFVR